MAAPKIFILLLLALTIILIAVAAVGDTYTRKNSDNHSSSVLTFTSSS